MKNIDGDLCDALNEGDLARAQKLVMAGADVNARDEFGETILEEISGTTTRRYVAMA